LYNAHALKRRARRFWARKSRGDVFDEEAEGMGWSPPRMWTAWPLAPQDVPRDGESDDEEDGKNESLFQREEGCVPSREVEESLVAVTLKLARKRFEARQSDERIEAEIAAEADLDEVLDNVEGVESSGQSIVKESSEPPVSETLLRPIISADDERSGNILRPSIRHILSKLDEVLMALHHTRETCHEIGSRSAANTDERVRYEASPSPAKRPRGRPRKFADLALLQKENQVVQTPVSYPEDLSQGEKKRGRPQKVYPRFENESEQEYLVRIARIQKKPLPSFAPPLSVTPPRSKSAASSKSRQSPGRHMTSEELKAYRLIKLGLRDWSEVLGAAALVGFPSHVIARATQRCADLFGESMTMMTLNESPFFERNTDFRSTYQPQAIPDFGDGIESSEQSSDESDLESSRDRIVSIKRKARADDGEDSWFCPVSLCGWHIKVFDCKSELRRHLERSHRMGSDEINELLDDHDEMDGAVHNDGFLKPISHRSTRGSAMRPQSRTKDVLSDVEEVRIDGVTAASSG
jgi:hypothetical protein